MHFWLFSVHDDYRHKISTNTTIYKTPTIATAMTHPTVVPWLRFPTSLTTTLTLTMTTSYPTVLRGIIHRAARRTLVRTPMHITINHLTIFLEPRAPRPPPPPPPSWSVAFQPQKQLLPTLPFHRLLIQQLPRHHLAAAAAVS